MAENPQLSYAFSLRPQLPDALLWKRRRDSDAWAHYRASLPSSNDICFVFHSKQMEASQHGK